MSTLILTCNTPSLPQSVKAGYLNIPVVPYIPNPLLCFKCHKFGHGQNTCRGKLTCARCGQCDLDDKTFHKDLECTNYKGKHFAYSRECPRWKFEKPVQQVKVVKHLSFTEARHVVETVAPPVSGKSYAAVVRVSTNNTSVQTYLTWPNTEDKFKKVSEIERAQQPGHQRFLETSK